MPSPRLGGSRTEPFKGDRSGVQLLRVATPSLVAPSSVVGGLALTRPPFVAYWHCTKQRIVTSGEALPPTLDAIELHAYGTFESLTVPEWGW